MPVAHKWRPIEDLGDDPKSLTDGELESLKRVWADQKTELAEHKSLGEFDQQLRREWAIETGIIENVYTLERGVTKTLVEKGIVAALIPHGATNRDPERVARIIQDHYDALGGMFDLVGGQRELTIGYIKELHAALLRNQDTFEVVDQLGRIFDKPLEKGLYKDSSNSPTRPDGALHEYCPPEHVASEMDRLVLLHRQHGSFGVPDEVEAAWLHHRFTQIHPFADGNGRVARAIASLVFIKSGWFPMLVRRDDWDRYIEGLEKADAGDLRPLVSFFVDAQRRTVVQATQVAYDVQLAMSADEAVAAVRNLQFHTSSQRWQGAKLTSKHLFEKTIDRFEQIGKESTGSTSRGFAFQRTFRKQPEYDDVRTEVVRRVGHTADFVKYGGSVDLTLDARRSDVLRLQFYAIGPRYRGLIGVVAYLLLLGTKPIIIKDGTFLINYAEDLATAKARFSPWLERVIVEGLNEWRRTL